MEEPSATGQERVLHGVYEHLRWVRDEQTTLYGMYVEKLQKVITVQLVLFAALAYGWNELGSLPKHGALPVVAIMLGVIAALALGYGFYIGVRLLGVTTGSVVGVKTLDSVVKSGNITRLSIDELWSDLSRNLATAIIEDRKRDHATRRKGPLLNCATIAGYIAVAVFVTVVSLGNYTGNLSSNGESDVSEEKPQTQQQPPAQVPQGTEEVSRPSVVEPTDSVQRSGLRPSVREPSDRVP